VQGSGTLHVMTVEQIRYWAERGVEFGGHSRTHADLTTLTADEARAEIEGSKADLTAILGTPPVSFAYPFGQQSDSIRALVSRSFDLAFGSEEGMNYLRCDRYLLNRTYVGASTSNTELRLILKFGEMKKLHEWRGRIALRTRLRRAFGISLPAK
jgi:hypothetical protein